MELRELIKSTVAELDELVQKDEISYTNSKRKSKEEIQNEKEVQNKSDEKEFLESIKERTEVLFLGLQTPEIVNLDDKLDITLKYLEFLLATVEERLKKYNS